jgi:hypothetical protein
MKVYCKGLKFVYMVILKTDLTPWKGIHFEELLGAQSIKNFLSIYLT